ncbi:MAG: YgaP family membrane protein [Gammaproteobacteria bacterium]
MKNVGTVDKVIRIILGLVLIALVFVGPQTPWGWIGIIPLATGLIGFCPLYSILGMNTSGTKKA